MPGLDGAGKDFAHEAGQKRITGPAESETWRQGDLETGVPGDRGTTGPGAEGTRGLGDEETRRQRGLQIKEP